MHIQYCNSDSSMNSYYDFSSVFHPVSVFPRDALRIFPTFQRQTNSAWSAFQQEVEVRSFPGVKGELLCLPLTLTFKPKFIFWYVSSRSFCILRAEGSALRFSSQQSISFVFPYLALPLTLEIKKRQGHSHWNRSPFGDWCLNRNWTAVANRDWRSFLRL